MIVCFFGLERRRGAGASMCRRICGGESAWDDHALRRGNFLQRVAAKNRSTGKSSTGGAGCVLLGLEGRAVLCGVVRRGGRDLGCAILLGRIKSWGHAPGIPVLVLAFVASHPRRKRTRHGARWVVAGVGKHGWASCRVLRCQNLGQPPHGQHGDVVILSEGLGRLSYVEGGLVAQVVDPLKAEHLAGGVSRLHNAIGE